MTRVGAPPTAADHVRPTGPAAATSWRTHRVWAVLDVITWSVMLTAALTIVAGDERFRVLFLAAF